MAQSAEVSDLVDAALADNAGAEASKAVIATGDAAVPELAARLNGASPEAQAGIIAVLGEIGTQATIAPLLPLMSSGERDTRERAARAVYGAVMAHGRPEGVAFDEAVIDAFGGEPLGAVLLLGGFVPDASAALSTHSGATQKVKLSNAGTAVPAGLAAQLALSRLGDTSARAALLSGVVKAEPDALSFYLSAIGMIDSPQVLHALARATLSNEAPVAGGVPSGVEPPRRLADVAVETFVERLKLSPDFALDGVRRYSSDERSAVTNLVTELLPQ